MYLRHRIPPGVKWILLITIGVFILQLLFDRGNSNQEGVLTHLLALKSQLFRKGYVWQAGTYMLLHSNTMLLHIVFNMLTLGHSSYRCEDIGRSTYP